MHYCYGLSVINSHLMRRRRAGPHRPVGRRPRASGSSSPREPAPPLRRRALHVRPARPLRLRGARPPSAALRHPGRWAAARRSGSRAYAELGRDRGWDFFVMYGQTEATARMAYLPPELARRPSRGDRRSRSRAGVPARPRPGARTDADVGELVYRGPNVMMGYATSPADLATGTDDRASCAPATWPGGTPTGCTRSSAAAAGSPRCSACGSTSTTSSGCSPGARRPGALCRRWATASTRSSTGTRDVAPGAAHGQLERCGLPAHAVRVGRLEGMPTTSNGKPTTPRCSASAAVLDARPTRLDPCADARQGSAAVGPRPVRRAARPPRRHRRQQLRQPRWRLAVLRRALGPRCGELLDRVPRGLAHADDRRAGELAEHSTRRRQCGSAARADGAAARGRDPARSSAPTRNLFTVYGGAHILLAVAGYNFARFQLGRRPPCTTRFAAGSARWRRWCPQHRVDRRWSALVIGTYEPATALFLNGLRRQRQLDDAVAVLVPRGVRLDARRGSRA